MTGRGSFRPEAFPLRSSLLALALAVIVVLAGTAFLTGADQRSGGRQTLLDAGATSFDATIVSFDATEIGLTVYRPAGADATSPVPVVLHSHGWSGSRTTDGSGIVGRLWNEGFGVVSIDARGHGESGGYATVHHKDAEVKDFQAILDWIHDNLDWVAKEPSSGVAKDVVAGAAGYSYAGGFQLMTASYDARLDAIAPEITWSFLPDSLAPNGVPKSLWIDFLYGQAQESGTRLDPRIHGWYQDILINNAVPAAAYDHFVGSSPRLEAITADVLLIQGIPDTLFPLNEALHTYAALEANGVSDVRLFTHLTGHVVPYLQPFGTTPDRRDIFQDDGPCGSIADAVSAWLDEKLRAGPASGIPEASYALEDGACLVLDALPETTIDATATLALAPSAAGTLLLPLAEGPLTIAGIPTLRANATAGMQGAYAFASLVVLGADGFTRVVDDQSMPIRANITGAIDVELAGVATTLGSGDQLMLRIDGLNEWYPHNSPRMPSLSVLSDVVVTLPIVD